MSIVMRIYGNYSSQLGGLSQGKAGGRAVWTPALFPFCRGDHQEETACDRLPCRYTQPTVLDTFPANAVTAPPMWGRRNHACFVSPIASRRTAHAREGLGGSDFE